MMLQDIAAAYCDGGVLLKNPSIHGGTYAWCHVDRNGEFIRGDSGLLLPRDMVMPVITNNFTEAYAMAMALFGLKDGWTGDVYTDSEITKDRFSGACSGWAGIPDWLEEFCKAQTARLGHINYHLLGGHPTRLELSEGKRKDGFPCSIHNVWCDKRCQELAKQWKAENAEKLNLAK